MGHYDQALLDWTTVLEYEKTFAAYFGRGLAQYHKKNYRKAYSDFRKATAYGVEARGYNAIGKCLKEVGEDLKAAEMQKKALEIDGNYKEAALDAAIAYMSQSMAKEAEEYLDKALALDPDFVIAHGWAALYYDQLGESRQVLASAQRTLELDPTQHTT
jgi:tetratricopeptide (TPR) repeat protein